MSDKLPFPEVVSDLRFIIAFSIFIYLFLFYLSFQAKAIDPVMFYLISGIYLLLLSANTTDWKKLNKVLGLKTPISGGWLLLAVWGFGWSMLFYSLFTYRAMAIFSGNSFVMSLIQPLYVPLALPQYSITLGFSTSLVGSSFFFMLVSLFEESYVLIGAKSISNFLVKKGMNIAPSVVLSFTIMRVVWAGEHYLSWGSLTPGSIIFAVAVGFLFYIPYIILDVSGLLTTQKTVSFVGVVSIPALFWHAGYDIFTTEGLLGIPYNQFVAMSLLLVILPPFLMYFLRRSQSGKRLIPIEYET